MAIKKLSNIAYICNISQVCPVHINSTELTESLKEPQDPQYKQDIIWHKLSSPKLLHNNVQYAIV